MNQHKRYVLVLAVAGICIAIGWYGYHRTVSDKTLNSDSAPMSFTYEVVQTPALREQGLSGRTSVPGDYGMLFVFDTADRYGIWMKDMLIPIDIVWLSDTGVIVGIVPSVATSTYPMPFYPPTPVRFILETRAGEVARKGWVPGTDLTLPLPFER